MLAYVALHFPSFMYYKQWQHVGLCCTTLPSPYIYCKQWNNEGRNIL